MRHGRGGHRHRDGRPQRPVLDLKPTDAQTEAVAGEANSPDTAEGSGVTGGVERAQSEFSASTMSSSGNSSAGEPSPADADTSNAAQDAPAGEMAAPGAEAAALATGSQALEAEPAPADSSSASDDALRPSAFASDSAASTTSTGGPSGPIPASAPPRPRPRSAFASAALGLLFGLLGGAGAAAAALWLVGLLPPSGPRYPDQVARVAALETQVRSLANRPAPAPAGADARTGEIATRVGALETQVHELATRPAPSAPAVAGSEPARDDGAAVQALEAARGLEARLGNVEAALAERSRQETGAANGAAAESGAAPAFTGGQGDEERAALAGRVAALTAESKALSDRLAELGRRVDATGTATQEARDAASRSVGAASATAAGITEQVGALGGRLQGIEATLKGLEAAAAKPDADVDRAARAAAAMTALRATAERGAPFAPELAAARAVIAQPQALAPLDAFAGSGLPRAGMLTRELGEELVKLRAKAAPPPSAGFLERIEASASKLVRVRPVDGTDAAAASRPADPLGALEGAAARADIPGALAAAEKLPADQRAALEPWIAKARSQQAATEALDRVARDTLAALRPASSEIPGQ